MDVTKTELRKMIAAAESVEVAAAFHGDRMAVVKVSKSETLRSLREEYDDYPSNERMFSAHWQDHEGGILFIG